MIQSVGIDLGTTNSAVSRIVGKKPVVFNSETGDTKVPSVVGFGEDSSEVYVGQTAVNFEAQNPNRVINSVKRKMGETDSVASVNGKKYSPEEISALILQKLKSLAERELGSEVTNAVITVPAYFDNKQREATKRAGQIAGFNVDRIINEPTAAMLYHGTQRNDDMTSMVYDLGGGTFDVSVVSVIDRMFEVIATDGLQNHGGDDWDAQLVGQIQTVTEKQTGVSVSDDPQITQRIWKAARKAKHDLSSQKRTKIRIPFLVEGYTFEETITREQFQEITSDLIEPTIDICYDTLDAAGLSKDDIDEVLLVGGSTRMPQVESRLRQEFGSRVLRSKSPDEVVSKGAAIQAGLINQSLPVIHNSGSSVLQQQEQNAVANRNSSSYELPKKFDEAMLIDVTSKSLGTRTLGDKFSKIIPRNTSIPVERTERFVTTMDHQTEILVRVYQGESMTASENRLLDDFSLTGLPRLPAGEAKVDITFRINANGILEATAKSVDKGHFDQITIESSIEYSKNEIEEIQATLPVVK